MYYYKWKCLTIFLNYLCNINTAETRIIACQNYNRLLGSDSDSAKIVHATLGDEVNLKCNFCEKCNIEAMQKIWFYKRRGSSEPPREITAKDFEEISFTSDTLLLKNFTAKHKGIYYCQSMNHDDNEIATFVLDSVFNGRVEPIHGDCWQWKEFKIKRLDPINKKLEWSEKEPFACMRKSLPFSFKLLYSWEIWGPCIQPHHFKKGYRQKIGKCMLRPIMSSCENMIQSLRDRNYTISYFFSDKYDIACSSEQLHSMLPKISQITSYMPDFEMEETCIANTAPNETESMVFKDNYKYITTKIIVENDHYTLICPEVTLESQVEWLMNGVKLNDSFKKNMELNENEPHLTIDSFNSLYILHATKREEGIYECIIDGFKNHKWTILVVSKSKLQKNEFMRYSIYLGFVLSLTMMCYCAGMCVAWHRRSSFINPLNQNSKRNSDPAHRE